MPYRVFRVPISNPEDAQEELNAFLRGNRIVHVRSDLVNDKGGAAYAFLVEYVHGGGKQKQKGGRVDYREVLPPEQFAVFARLREVRKRLAEEHGVPVYTVFTNEQLADIDRKPPTNAKDLSAVDGVGPARTEKFGTAILAVLRADPSASNASGGSLTQSYTGTTSVWDIKKRLGESEANTPFSCFAGTSTPTLPRSERRFWIRCTRASADTVSSRFTTPKSAVSARRHFQTASSITR